MSKKMNKKITDLGKELHDSYELWNTLYTTIGHDPTWPDGVNLNLVRNHILYYRHQCEDAGVYPEEYSLEVPEEVDNNYCACADEIRSEAVKKLALYRKNRDYKYLLKNRTMLSEKEQENIHIGNVIGYVTGLEKAIENDDLVTMRRHMFVDFLQSFADCRKRLDGRVAATKPVQLSLFG